MQLGQHVVLSLPRGNTTETRDPQPETRISDTPLDRLASVGIPTVHDATAYLDSP